MPGPTSSGLGRAGPATRRCGAACRGAFAPQTRGNERDGAQDLGAAHVEDEAAHVLAERLDAAVAGGLAVVADVRHRRERPHVLRALEVLADERSDRVAATTALARALGRV